MLLEIEFIRLFINKQSIYLSILKYSAKLPKKGGQYHYQVAIISSLAYKQLTRKYTIIKQQQMKQRQKQLQQLNKYKAQKQRILNERVKIEQKRDDLRMKIEEIREKNQYLRNQQLERNEQYQYRMMNMDYLRNMVLGMRYQNGMDIDPDNMTYEQLLQLQQKIGNVSKGLTSDQISLLPRHIFNQSQDKQQLCSICYYNVKDKQLLLILPCKHLYHSECIIQWLGKEKMCPMCKQEIKIQGNNIGTINQYQCCHQQQQQENNCQDEYYNNNSNQDDQAKMSSMYHQEDCLQNQIDHQNYSNININLNINGILQGQLQFTQDEGFKQIDLNDQ